MPDANFARIIDNVVVLHKISEKRSGTKKVKHVASSNVTGCQFVATINGTGDQIYARVVGTGLKISAIFKKD
jgi:hypothetical protein